MRWALAIATGCSTMCRGCCAKTAHMGFMASATVRIARGGDAGAVACARIARGEDAATACAQAVRGGDAAAGLHRGETAIRGKAGRADTGFRKLSTGERVATLGARLAWRTSRNSRMSCALSPWDITELPPGDSMDEVGEQEPVRSRVEPGEFREGKLPGFSALEGSTQISRGGCASGTVCRCLSSLRCHISASMLRNSTGTSAVAPPGCVGHFHGDGGSVVPCISASASAAPSHVLSTRLASVKSRLRSLSKSTWLFCRADSVIVRGESGASDASLSGRAQSLNCSWLLRGVREAADAGGATNTDGWRGAGLDVEGELRRGERGPTHSWCTLGGGELRRGERLGRPDAGAAVLAAH